MTLTPAETASLRALLMARMPFVCTDDDSDAVMRGLCRKGRAKVVFVGGKFGYVAKC